jgi:hypothetical protein
VSQSERLGDEPACNPAMTSAHWLSLSLSLFNRFLAFYCEEKATKYE